MCEANFTAACSLATTAAACAGLPCLQAKKPYMCEHLSALSKLSSLVVLELCSPNAARLVLPAATQLQDAALYSWLGALTSLTALVLSLPTASGFASIGACTRLQHLGLRSVSGFTVVLGETEWGAIAQLTKLTSLYTGASIEGTTVPAFNSALGHLRYLQQLGVRAWSSDSVPVLADLPSLRTIQGMWEAGTAYVGAAGFVCTQVTCLQDVHGDVPFWAFPNLRKLVQTGCFTLDSFASLPQHCTGLQEIWVNVTNTDCKAVMSLPWLTDEAVGPERTTAIRSLSAAGEPVCACVETRKQR